MSQRRIDTRTLVLILAAGAIGSAWALLNLQQAGDARDATVLRPLVWVIFAIPFCAFWGWLIARPSERWRAFVSCLAVYFFTIFIAARIEDLALGRDQAQAARHHLYFQTVIVCQALAVVALAVQRAWTRRHES